MIYELLNEIEQRAEAPVIMYSHYAIDVPKLVKALRKGVDALECIAPEHWDIQEINFENPEGLRKLIRSDNKTVTDTLAEIEAILKGEK
jgi:hypothetical protein